MTFTCRADGCEREFDSKPGRTTHEYRTHSDDAFPWKREDVLRRLYFEERHSLTEIGEKFGVDPRTISKWMDEHGIDKAPWRDEDTLRDLYWEHDLSQQEVAERLSCEPSVVTEWMGRLGIESRPRSIAVLQPYASLRMDKRGHEVWRDSFDGQNIRVAVHQMLSIAEGADPHEVFADNTNVHHGVEDGRLPAAEIPWANWPGNIRLLTISEHTKHHNPGLDWLEKLRATELYRNGDVSQRTIAEQFGVLQQTVSGAVSDVLDKSFELERDPETGSYTSGAKVDE